jgi:hypothetical protein
LHKWDIEIALSLSNVTLLIEKKRFEWPSWYKYAQNGLPTYKELVFLLIAPQ